MHTVRLKMLKHKIRQSIDTLYSNKDTYTNIR